ncbi:MAG TPA: hypothetical protein VKA40_07955 [Nitrososphaera sp.]|nr:hypothetical protein [Nitrososphaera sp.]
MLSNRQITSGDFREPDAELQSRRGYVAMNNKNGRTFNSEEFRLNSVKYGILMQKDRLPGIFRFERRRSCELVATFDKA